MRRAVAGAASASDATASPALVVRKVRRFMRFGFHCSKWHRLLRERRDEVSDLPDDVLFARKEEEMAALDIDDGGSGDPAEEVADPAVNKLAGGFDVGVDGGAFARIFPQRLLGPGIVDEGERGHADVRV